MVRVKWHIPNLPIYSRSRRLIFVITISLLTCTILFYLTLSPPSHLIQPTFTINKKDPVSAFRRGAFETFDSVTLTTIETTTQDHITQDDSEMIAYLRSEVLHPPPASSNGGIVISSKNPHENPSEQLEIYNFVMKILNEHPSGFYIECGANDGELYSNTLPFDLTYPNWSGLLIEPDPKPLSQLLKRNRKAWIAPVCLSTRTWPTKVDMVRPLNDDLLTRIGNNGPGEKFTADCYPLFSLLLAVNVTIVDYFSLDIEGMELDVLKTIPWDKVKIKVLSIEVPNPPWFRGVMKVDLYLRSIGFKFVSYIHNRYSHDNIYVHSSVNFAM